MKTVTILLGYNKWHYSKALASLFRIWKNFFHFLFDYFSIKELARNLFDPWKRMRDPYPKNFNFKAYLFAFIVNLITRLIGLVMRLVFLIIGLIVLIIFVILLPLLFIIWLLLPFILIALILSGLYLIF